MLWNTSSSRKPRSCHCGRCGPTGCPAGAVRARIAIPCPEHRSPCLGTPSGMRREAARGSELALLYKHSESRGRHGRGLAATNDRTLLLMVTTDLDPVARLVAAHAQRAEEDGRLPREVVEAIREAGFPRHFVTEAWQGERGTFRAYASAVASMGEIDASAAWSASIAASMGRMAAYLPAEGQQALWERGPDVFVCGTLQPAGTAAPSPGGWAISGRWPFVTGVHFSDWALLTCRTQSTTDGGGELRTFLVPRSAYSIEEIWRSPGMCATGSDTLVVSGARVPQGCTFARQTLHDGKPSAADGAVYAIAHEAVSGLVFAAPLLGAARGALAEWIRSARHKMTTSRAADQKGVLALARTGGEIRSEER